MFGRRNDSAARKRRLGRGLCIVIGAGAALLCVAGAAALPTKKSAAPVLTIGVNALPSSLDPTKDNDGEQTTYRVLSNTPIIFLKADGTLAPGLATSWRYVPQKYNKQFEFTLRHGARFSDGHPLTAKSVVNWLNYFEKAGTSPYIAYMGPSPKFTAVNKYTVKITTEVPNPKLGFVLSQNYNWGLVSGPASLANPSLLSTQSDGVGPYQLDTSNTVQGDHYTYVPDPYYYDKKAQKWSQVVVKYIPTPSSMLQAIETGQLDVAYGDPSTAAKAQSAGLTVATGEQGYRILSLLDRNGRVLKPLADPRVRQAMNYAIDRKAVTQAIVGSFGSPTSEPLSPDGFDKKYANYYTYNPTKAKALLTAAGYPNGFDLHVLTLAATQPWVDAAAKYLDAVGVHVIDDVAVSAPDITAKLASAQYPASVANVGSVSMWFQYSLWFAPSGGRNVFKVDDPTVDKLFYTGITASNPSKYWLAITHRVVQQADMLFLFNYDIMWYVGPHVKGVVLGPGRIAIPLATEWSPK
jgi:peptide/nickel transport system substrate-binding protein